jgi:light-regulated signal transduction histidine kinase (bacteriophytochrome)
LELQVQQRTKDLQTANKELEVQKKQIQIHADALKRSNEELEQFAYVASHDLQEPLRMISSYIALLAKRYRDKLDSDAEEFIDFATDGAKRMQVMIDDLLQYSRVTTRGKPFEKVDMEQILLTVLNNLKVAIEECKAKLTHDTLPTIIADRIQMERLLQNLLANAIKYRGDRNPNVHISVKKRKGEYIFSIQDNGIGIKEKYQEQIFGIFQRLHSREEYSGTGIGLAVCKKTVQRHGGKIWVESPGEGKGSTFYFTLSTDLRRSSPAN